MEERVFPHPIKTPNVLFIANIPLFCAKCPPAANISYLQVHSRSSEEFHYYFPCLAPAQQFAPPSASSRVVVSGGSPGGYFGSKLDTPARGDFIKQQEYKNALIDSHLACANVFSLARRRREFVYLLGWFPPICYWKSNAKRMEKSIPISPLVVLVATSIPTGPATGSGAERANLLQVS